MGKHIIIVVQLTLVGWISGCYIPENEVNTSSNRTVRDTDIEDIENEEDATASRSKSRKSNKKKYNESESNLEAEDSTTEPKEDSSEEEQASGSSKDEKDDDTDVNDQAEQQQQQQQALLVAQGIEIHANQCASCHRNALANDRRVNDKDLTALNAKLSPGHRNTNLNSNQIMALAAAVEDLENSD